MTPDCCPETRDNQQHITGDVAFATRQYWAVTEDYSWLFGEKYGFPLDVTEVLMKHSQIISNIFYYY